MIQVLSWGAAVVVVVVVASIAGWKSRAGKDLMAINERVDRAQANAIETAVAKRALEIADVNDPYWRRRGRRLLEFALDEQTARSTSLSEAVQDLDVYGRCFAADTAPRWDAHDPAAAEAYALLRSRTIAAAVALVFCE